MLQCDTLFGMTSSSRIPPGVDDEAARLLERAYSLETDEDTHALYRDWAGTYDKTMLDGLGYTSPALVAGLLADHLPDRGTALLDVGCGTGLAGKELAGHGFTTIDGLDYSAEMLGVAGARDIYRALIKADLTAPLALPDAAYGGAICTGTFTHGHVGPVALRELFRLLKPGAPFAFSVNAGVWDEMGFGNELAAIEHDGMARCVSRTAGTNYQTSNEPDSWLNLYERT
jgi:predicted TPR repeat methyltransferase